MNLDVCVWSFVSFFIYSEYPSCNTDDFTCSDHQCILNSARCDLIQDCYTGSDEAMCGGKTINLCIIFLACLWTVCVLQFCINIGKKLIHWYTRSKSTIKWPFHLVLKQWVSSKDKELVTQRYIVNSTTNCFEF